MKQINTWNIYWLLLAALIGVTAGVWLTTNATKPYHEGATDLLLLCKSNGYAIITSPDTNLLVECEHFGVKVLTDAELQILKDRNVK